MCYGKEGRAPRPLGIDAASVGVLAYRTPTGPVACAITPYVDGSEVVISSTLALLAKVKAVRRDARIALLAGGLMIRGRARFALDDRGETFAARLRAQELRKYPPARVLLGVPGHRRLLWWYVGRVLLRLAAAPATAVCGPDRVTLTVVDGDGLPTIWPLSDASALHQERIDLATLGLENAVPSGPACILVHEEHHDMADLRQLLLRGTIADGHFAVAVRRGDLAPQPRGVVAQIRQLRALARAARRNRALIARWRAEGA